MSNSKNGGASEKAPISQLEKLEKDFRQMKDRIEAERAERNAERAKQQISETAKERDAKERELIEKKVPESLREKFLEPYNEELKRLGRWFKTERQKAMRPKLNNVSNRCELALQSVSEELPEIPEIADGYEFTVKRIGGKIEITSCKFLRKKENDVF